MLSNNLLLAVNTTLENTLHRRIVIGQAQQVFGGDINQTFLLQTNAGKFFLKTNSDALPDMFEKESAGLVLLQSASALAVPNPVAEGNIDRTIFLVMEYIEKGKPDEDFWQQFGHGLAALHKNTQANFGLSENDYIGTILQSNTLTTTWAAFYTQQRIMPLMQKALQQNKCSVNDVQAAEKLCTKFGELFSREPSALLHGDLWSGNFMVGQNGQPVIYDPAVYYGHREMDIAMTMLFGGFDKKLYDHYNEALPLQPGWQQRTGLCQLYPLLVHLLLFGGHYYDSVMNVINRYK